MSLGAGERLAHIGPPIEPQGMHRRPAGEADSAGGRLVRILQKVGQMETKFGKWITGRGFPVFFFAILIAAVGYVGLRWGNALEWGMQIHAYTVVFALLILLLPVLIFLLSGNGDRFLGGYKRAAAYFACFLLYDVLAMAVLDLASLILRLDLVVRAWLILAAAAFSALVVVYGSIHARQLQTVRYSVHLEKQHAPLRIVLLSDLHIGAFINAAYLQRVVQRIETLSPDLIVIAGDLFDGSLPDERKTDACAAALSRMHAPLGVYAVIGNHDPDVSDVRFQRFLRDAGICLLYNEVACVAQWNLAGRAGIVDMGDLRVPLAELLGKREARYPTVVLDHDPQGIREAADCGAELVLCGHTHKGQFFPMTILTRLANGKDYFYGSGFVQKTCFVISSGTGYFELPIRIGTNSEIVVVDVA